MHALAESTRLTSKSLNFAGRSSSSVQQPLSSSPPCCQHQCAPWSSCCGKWQRTDMHGKGNISRQSAAQPCCIARSCEYYLHNCPCSSCFSSRIITGITVAARKLVKQQVVCGQSVQIYSLVSCIRLYLSLRLYSMPPKT